MIFDRMVNAAELLEWARVLGRHWYGTPRAPVEQALLDGGEEAEWVHGVSLVAGWYARPAREVTGGPRVCYARFRKMEAISTEHLQE